MEPTMTVEAAIAEAIMAAEDGDREGFPAALRKIARAAYADAAFNIICEDDALERIQKRVQEYTDE